MMSRCVDKYIGILTCMLTNPYLIFVVMETHHLYLCRVNLTVMWKWLGC